MTGRKTDMVGIIAVRTDGKSGSTALLGHILTKETDNDVDTYIGYENITKIKGIRQ
jgi:hypothetical protein